MELFNISKAKTEDALEISKLQQKLLLNNNKNSTNGFLVSAFTEEDYQNFIETYNHFYIARMEGKICGVIMAYHSNLISSSNQTNMLLKYSLKSDFILIKQVFISPEFSTKGIATKLYNHLFEQESNSLPYVAVIVSEPINVASYKFHLKHNFSNYLDFEPDADKDGIVRDRSAWIKLPSLKDDLSDYIRLTNQNQGDDFGETILSRSSELVSLYTHEDNLNWTKMGMQITLIFALFAAFVYFYEKELIPESIPVVTILAIWGFTINLVFYLKIKSGLQYMTHHKNNIIRFDKKIKMYFPLLNPIFPNNSIVSKKSITLKLLPWLSLLGLVSWLLVSLLLFFKGLNIFSFAI